MNPLLIKSSLNHFLRHPWQIGLSFVAIALGVAVVISIDLANQSARQAFQRSMEQITGKATHQIIASSVGFPDSLYRYLRVDQSLRRIAPVVEGTVRIIADNPHTFTLLGIDLFAERPFRQHLQRVTYQGQQGFNEFLTQPAAVVMSASVAKRLGIDLNDQFELLVAGRNKSVILIGIIKADEGQESPAGLDHLLFTDIASGQELLEMPGRLSRIDVIVDDDKRLTKLRSLLPQGIRLAKSQSRSETSDQMISAFRTNLNAMSLLALIVGMFLIYNMMTFSVLQRTVYIGLMRAIGFTGKNIFLVILTEALILAIIGSTLGLLLGYLLAGALIHIISRTINDLYFVLSVRQVELSFFSITKGVLLGIVATLVSAAKPAIDAARATISVTLKRSAQESKLSSRIMRFTISGLVMLAGGYIILTLSRKDIAISYLGIFFVIIGFSLLSPAMIALFTRIVKPVSARLFGTLGRMAAAGISAQISRTSVAIAALALAVAASVGVSTMVSSFRSTVVFWLEQRIQADLYISAPTLVSRRNDASLPRELLTSIQNLPEVRGVNFYRELQIDYKDQRLHVIGAELSEQASKTFLFKAGNPRQIWPAFRKGEGLLVTEPYAFKNDLTPGDLLEIPGTNGFKKMKVLGIYYDYGSDLGLITMPYSVFTNLFNDFTISGISVYGQPGTDLDQLRQQIQTLAPQGLEVIVRTSKYLREMSIDIFDRTFIIANILQLLAIIVAFIGIFTALMSLQLERKRELGVLRANGLTPQQLWGLTNLQTGLMGIIAGLLAIPLGHLLAWILIYVINQRSFGWTLQFQISADIFWQSLLLAIAASLLAGIYPSIKMTNTSPALALREE